MAVASSVAEREAPRTDVLYWAKRSFGYGTSGTGKQLDRGQVFKLEGLPNDALLVDLGYVGLVPKDKKPFPCRVCGAQFLEQSMRDGHGKQRHEERPFTPPSPPEKEPGESKDAYQNRLDEWAQAAGRMADAHDEGKVRKEDTVAPLDLTKTAASRKG